MKSPQAMGKRSKRTKTHSRKSSYMPSYTQKTGAGIKIRVRKHKRRRSRVSSYKKS